MKFIAAVVSVTLSFYSYVAILFSGDNVPPRSWTASMSAFFGQEFITGIAAVVAIAVSLFWLVKRPHGVTRPILIDLLIIIVPLTLWGLLLSIFLIDKVTGAY